MFNFKNVTRGIFILIICLGIGVTFSKIYQPEAKNIKVYKQALRDYENENYSNSYFLFSKVAAVSSLKPIALYRQAMCAKNLGDKKSELKVYQQLINYYPQHKLSGEARYNAGQLILEENPGLAYRYFDKVSKSDMEDGYKYASEYFKARITATKIRYSGKKPSDRKIKEVEVPFRAYLEKYPDGRLAANVARTWKKFNPKLSKSDRILIARAYTLSKNNTEAMNTISTIPEKDVWALKTLVYYSRRDYKNGNALLDKWIKQQNKTVSRKDFNRVIDGYVAQYTEFSDKYKILSTLLNSAKDPKKDYIWNLKCKYSPDGEKYPCYNGLYNSFPTGDYSRNAMFKTFSYSLKERNYQKSRSLANTYLEKYSNSKEAPMVMFWVAKIDNNRDMFNNIIKQYPDSFYAYRSFWITKGLKSATVRGQLKNKPVVYPYKMPGLKSTLYALMCVNDYEMIKKYSDDKFIESWVEYENGNYTTSMIIARDAMSKLPEKPNKSDLRWRLVYPQNYFAQVKKYASQTQNNEALIMAILREESSFNTKAQSGVGAMGLMQLMPDTAQDVASRNKISLETIYLVNPEINIKLGNLYYSELKKGLGNDDISAVAAYNGGIGAVTGWKNKLNYSDVDEFIIQIPYEETQYYIEKIFGSYWNYTRIYQR